MNLFLPWVVSVGGTIIYWWAFMALWITISQVTWEDTE